MDKGLIFYDFEATSWNWDEEGIARLEVSEDIMEFLVQNSLQGTLQENTIEILKLAACLGNREFNTLILSAAVGLPAEEVDQHCSI